MPQNKDDIEEQELIQVIKDRKRGIVKPRAPEQQVPVAQEVREEADPLVVESGKRKKQRL